MTDDHDNASRYRQLRPEENRPRERSESRDDPDYDDGLPIEEMYDLEAKDADAS